MTREELVKSRVVTADQLAPSSSLNCASGWRPQAGLAEALLTSSQSPWVWGRATLSGQGFAAKPGAGRCPSLAPSPSQRTLDG